jgi:arylsulfatase A-like enzyme/Tfp pilus assembly protein PilF
MVRHPLCLALTIFAIALSAGCRRENTSPPMARQQSHPPLFIISIDTLRSDRLPVYGYATGRTPHIDAFRRDAILFRRAYGSVPLTLPSHASLLTGLQPYVHGVRDNIGYGLDGNRATLASILTSNGYATGAAVSTFVLRGETGISAGFSFYDDLMKVAPRETMSSWQRDGDETRAVLEDWLSKTSGDRIFGFLHLYEPHTPYTPPEPYASELDDPYDGEIAYADAIVGRFLETLKRRGLYDKSMIVVLSDHGEGLGEHGELEHGVFVYRESIQVPLLVKLPDNRRAGEEHAGVVSLVDLIPTILPAIGIDAPPGLDGVDVLGTVHADRSIYAESYYPRLHYGWRELHALIDDDYHFVDAPTVELYATADSAQLANVAEENRRVVAAMRSRIGSIVDAHPFKEPSVADPEDVKKLEALGYLGSTASPGAGALPDPKENVALLEQFGRGAGYFQAGDYDRAIAAARKIVDENPQFLQGWGLLSSAWQKKGNLPAALLAMEEQMRRSPGNPQTALTMASLLLDMRRFDDARRHAELAIDATPSLAYELMGSIALAKGDLAQAEADAKKSLEAAPLRVQPLMILSQVHHTEKRYAEELGLLDQVHGQVEARRVAPIRELEFRRGEALLQLGRRLEAEQAYRAETVYFPDHRRAWLAYALVVGAQGRIEESRTILRAALEANPNDSMRRGVREALEIMGDKEGMRLLGVG